MLAGIERTEERERSSIFSATAGVLAAYNADSVRSAASNPNFDPRRFVGSTDTIYITAPEHKQALCAPLIVGLLEQIRHTVYERARTEQAAWPPMLWALDEMANTAPIHDLPALISQAGGQGLQVMIGLQDLSQARTRWGDAQADGLMSLFQTKLILSGIAETRTLESISIGLGEYDRQTVSQSVGVSEPQEWLATPTQNETVTYNTQRQRVLTPGEIAKLPPGRGLLLQGADWRARSGSHRGMRASRGDGSARQAGYAEVRRDYVNRPSALSRNAMPSRQTAAMSWLSSKSKMSAPGGLVKRIARSGRGSM